MTRVQRLGRTPWAAVRIVLAAVPLAVTAAAAPALAAGGTTTGADLQLSGSANTNSPAPGAAFTESFQIKNAGPDTATSVVFTDLLPLAFTYGSATVNGAPACSAAPDATGNIDISCALGDMASATQATVVISLTAPTTTGTYGTTAVVSSPTADPNTANNSVNLSFQISGGGGGGGTTTTQAGPCATIDPSSSSQTSAGAVNRMQTTVTSCSSDTQTNMVVLWDPGVSNPDGEAAFSCAAPQNTTGSPIPGGLSFSLSPGAKVNIQCNSNSPVGDGVVASGVGTVTLYNNCASFDSPEGSTTSQPAPTQSLLDPSLRCEDVPSTAVASAAFTWSINTPASTGPARQRH